LLLATRNATKCQNFGKIFLVHQLFWGIAHFVENHFAESHKDNQKISG
jgi:hypothetical protein